MRYDQARAYMFLDHLTHIARAASKSWRASAWLLERAFPEECNLRHRTPDASTGDIVSRSPDGDTPHQPDPHKPEAQAREESPRTTDDSTDDAGPATPFADSGRATQEPTTDSCPPTPDLNLAPFETDALLNELASLGYGSPSNHGLPADDLLFTFWKLPPPPPRNHNALRERIYAENPTGFALDQMIEEENRKERSLRNAAQLHTHYPCDPADLGHPPPPG